MSFRLFNICLVIFSLLPFCLAIDKEIVATAEESTLQVVIGSTVSVVLGFLINFYLDNPLGWLLKWLIFGGVATGLYLYLCTDFFTEHKIEKENEGTYMHWTIRWYTSLPWNILSRFYGFFAKIPIPRSLRRTIYGSYSRRYNVNMEEAEKPFDEYPTFGSFFNRKLKPGVRPISKAPVVSPADGFVMHYGEVKEGDKIVYAKGEPFDMKEFLGPVDVHLQPHKKLYQVCIYLARGSYHSYHSPANWTIKELFHHPGDLFNVAPSFINYIPRICCVNERVSICGKWEHGFMSMTPIAATYVGDIVIDVENPSHPILSHGNDIEPYSHHKELNHDCKKGEKIGQFRNGSVNVLVFEGPPNMKFVVKPGQPIKYGEAIVE